MWARKWSGIGMFDFGYCAWCCRAANRRGVVIDSGEGSPKVKPPRGIFVKKPVDNLWRTPGRICGSPV